MDSIQLSRTGQPELCFEGERLAKVNSPKCSGADGERGYELSLYAKAGGGFVVRAEYLTTFSTEKNIAIAEIVDDPKDVENFFFVIEPCEHLDPQLVRSLPEEQKQQLKRSLCQIYDGQVDAILAALEDYASSPNAAEKLATSEPLRPKNSLLNFLGLD